MGEREEKMTLSKVYEQISEDAKKMEVSGVVIVLVTKTSPIVIRTIPNDIARILFSQLAETSDEKIQEA